jgi:hypothetical protein
MKSPGYWSLAGVSAVENSSCQTIPLWRVGPHLKTHEWHRKEQKCSWALTGPETMNDHAGEGRHCRALATHHLLPMLRVEELYLRFHTHSRRDVQLIKLSTRFRLHSVAVSHGNLWGSVLIIVFYGLGPLQKKNYAVFPNKAVSYITIINISF